MFSLSFNYVRYHPTYYRKVYTGIGLRVLDTYKGIYRFTWNVYTHSWKSSPLIELNRSILTYIRIVRNIMSVSPPGSVSSPTIRLPWSLTWNFYLHPRCSVLFIRLWSSTFSVPLSTTKVSEVFFLVELVWSWNLVSLSQTWRLKVSLFYYLSTTKFTNVNNFKQCRRSYVIISV